MWVAGDVLILESDGSNWFAYYDGLISHQARITRTAAQTITNNTATKIAFDTEDYDNAGIGDIVTNDRIDILRAGRYNVNVQYGETSPTEISCRIYLNGALNKIVQHNTISTGTSKFMNFTTVLDLAATDYVELYVVQVTGGNANTNNNAYDRPLLAVSEIR